VGDLLAAGHRARDPHVVGDAGRNGDGDRNCDRDAGRDGDRNGDRDAGRDGNRNGDR